MKYIDDARKLRPLIELAVQSLDDETAIQAVALYPIWTEDATYAIDFKVQYEEKLYKCIQEHTSLSIWTPSSTPTLWTCINETHMGSIDEPIPYDGNMVLETGLYYIQNGVVYLCIRGTVNPVYHNLSDLVGLYVEVA